MTAEVTATLSSVGKRRRAEEDEPIAHPPLEQNPEWGKLPLIRDEKLWFEDGTVVLRTLGAPATPDGPPTVHAFKCHRSILASRSPFLRSIFDIFLAGTGQPDMDGVPCFDLQDRFEDVRDLLLIMYGSRPWHKWQTTEGSDPDVIMLLEGVLKLAAKYEASKEYMQIVKILEHEFVTSYEEWRSTEETMRNLVNLCRDSQMHESMYGEKRPNPVNTWPEPACTLVLAEELNLKALLHSAWYEVARCHGCGPTPFSKPDSDVPEYEHRRVVNFDRLSGSQMRRLVVGRERLLDALHPRMRTLHQELYDYEEDPPEPHAECLANVRKWWGNALSGKRFVDLVRDPLGELLRLQTSLRNEATLRVYHGTCMGGCSYGWFGVKLQRAGREIWDLLPEIFGFDA